MSGCTFIMSGLNNSPHKSNQLDKVDGSSDEILCILHTIWNVYYERPAYLLWAVDWKPPVIICAWVRGNLFIIMSVLRRMLPPANSRSRQYGMRPPTVVDSIVVDGVTYGTVYPTIYGIINLTRSNTGSGTRSGPDYLIVQQVTVQAYMSPKIAILPEGLLFTPEGLLSNLE